MTKHDKKSVLIGVLVGLFGSAFVVLGILYFKNILLGTILFGAITGFSILITMVVRDNVG